MTRLLGITGLILLCTSPAQGAPPGRGVNLAGLEGWTVVTGADASPSEQYAVEEFQRVFKEASGAEVPFATSPESAPGRIFIGPSDALRAVMPDFDVAGYGSEDFRIVIRDDVIAIAGGRPRGTLYGVYTFVEDYLGVRFLTKDHTHIPPIGPWRVVGPVDRFVHPPLRFRWSYYHANTAHPEFAARVRVNTVSDNPRLGGKTGVGLINHSLSEFLPVSEYAETHPEYVALVDGERKVDMGGGGPQLCLTNPEVLEIVTASVLKKLEANPAARNISVSQMDNAAHCRCENCAALDEKEGTPMGSLLTFVNAVADEVAGVRPDVYVGTLAYWYSRRPPKNLKPRPNVQIQLCSIECSVMQPIDDPDCELNTSFCRDMTDWGTICTNINIWNYNTNFRNYLLPTPNLRVIEPNIRYFVANNARGIFMQANSSEGGDFSDLRNYVIANLLWDPNRSGQALLNEFLDLHYGRAAPPIGRFLDRLHDNIEAKGLVRNCFGKAEHYGVDEAMGRAGLDAFAEARALADDEAVLRRVEEASICAYRAAIEPIWYVEDPSTVDPETAERLRPLVERFIELCEKYGVTQDREAHPFHIARDRIKRAVGL